MQRLNRNSVKSSRQGFTLIELLVVISIIAVLASLIAPAVQSARRAARKLECLNNMRNVGIAMQNFASSTNGNLPNLTQDVTNSAGNGTVYGASWVLPLLPALDQSSLLKNMRLNAVASGTVVTTATTFSNQDLIWLQVLTCPDDNDSFRTTGGLSFVVNAGLIASTVWGATETNLTPTTSTGIYHQQYMIDWNIDGRHSTDGINPAGTQATFDTVDASIATSAGVFFRQNSHFTATVDQIGAGDGQSSTLLITENLNAGKWNDSRDSFTGYGVNELGFGIAIPVGANYQPTASLFNSYATATFNANVALRPTNSWYDTTIMPDAWVINRNLTPGVGIAPRPSSQHANGVNVIFADGRGQFLNDAIDKINYAKLLSPNGVTFGETTLDSAAY